jgi:hypothetical protein
MSSFAAPNLDGEITIQAGDKRNVAITGIFVNMPVGLRH